MTPLFGSPGWGQALDVFWCVPCCGLDGLIVCVALVGAVLRSRTLVGLSLGVSAVAETLFIFSVATYHPNPKSSDELGIHAQNQIFVGLWMIALCASMAAAVYLYRNHRQEPDAPNDTDDAVMEDAEHETQPAPAEGFQSGVFHFRFRVVWLLALCLMLFLLSVLVMLSR